LTIDGQLVLGGNESEVQLGAGNLQLSAAVSRGAAASGTVRIGAQVVTLGQSQNQFSVNDSPELVEFEINAPIAGNAPGNFLEKSSAGALRLTGASTYQGGTLITGGTLIIDNTTGSGTGTGTVTVQTAARLAGDGSTASLVQMQNGATIGPSGSTGFPIGSLNIGSLSMNTASMFEVEFNHALPLAVRRDVLTVAGSAMINGNLVLRNLNAGGTPGPLETYSILTAATLTGSFVNVANGQRLSTSDGSGSFIVNYGASSAFTPNQVVLSAFESSLAGDFDSDGDVDGNDFVVWQRGGSPSPVSPGDLAAWRGSFGLPHVAATAAVPEPGALALGLAACIVLEAVRRKRANL
jgi:autotransporter-associated beta strand protein